MVTEGMKNVTAGANPMDIRRGMSKAVAKAVETIKAHSQKVKDSNDIARVGTISAGDPEIGRLIAEAMEKVTSDGVITIEENKTTSSTAVTLPRIWSPIPTRWWLIWTTPLS